MKTIKKDEEAIHPYIPELKDLYQQGRISRRQFLRTAAMLGLSLTSVSAFLTACAPQDKAITTAQPTATPEAAANPTPAVKRGGILRWDWAWIPYMADPAQDDVGTGEAGRNIAETLTWVDANNIPRPLLVERWKPSEDAKEWTLYLQQGVKFNNGKDFTAGDVVWNFQHWLDPKVGSPLRDRFSFLSPSGIEKVDDNTIKLHLDRASYGIPWSLCHYTALIMPEGGCDDFYRGDAKSAVGTGPFLMKEFLPDERMELVRREDYWQKGVDGNPLPYFDGMRVVAGLTDATALAALVGDNIDLIRPGLGILQELEAHTDIVVDVVPSAASDIIRVRCDQAPFDDPRVRNALKWCQDRERLMELAYPRGTLAWDHWISPLHEGWCPDTDKDRPQDIAKARALLAEAGHPDGFEVEMTTPTTPEYEPAMAQVLKEMAAPAGIKININVLPDSVYWEKWDQYLLSTTSWSGYTLGVENLNVGCRCGAIWNEMHWCNKEFDSILDQAEGTVDVEQRRKLFCQLQTIMQEDSGLLLPFWVAQTAAYQKRLRGYQRSPLPFYYWLNVWMAE